MIVVINVIRQKWFHRGIVVNFNIIEEILDVCRMRSTATDRKIIEKVNLELEMFNVNR